jgi:hypothetical protein
MESKTLEVIRGFEREYSGTGWGMEMLRANVTIRYKCKLFGCVREILVTIVVSFCEGDISDSCCIIVWGEYK